MKRWPLIRHVRWLVLAYAFAAWWAEIGQDLWLAPNASDLQFLDDVWKGRA